MNNNNFKYVSMSVITNRILRHPMLKNMNFDDIISYTEDVLRLVNMPLTYVEKSIYKPIVDYKALLPNDHLNIKSVDVIQAGHAIPMVIGTDMLHNHLNKLENRTSSNEFTYTINGCTVNTNCKEGTIFIVYDSLATDKDGIPMIPDNKKLILAIENYIKMNMFSIYADMGKMPRASAEKAEQNYGWYIGGAQTAFQGFINDDHMESFLRDFKRLFIINNSHDSRNKYNVNKELRYKE